MDLSRRGVLRRRRGLAGLARQSAAQIALLAGVTTSVGPPSISSSSEVIDPGVRLAPKRLTVVPVRSTRNMQKFHGITSAVDFWRRKR